MQNHGFIIFSIFFASALPAFAADPFNTELMTAPIRPATNTSTCPPPAPLKHPLALADVVNLTLCNNPQTRQAWANSLSQAAQLGVSNSAYLPTVSANISGDRSSNSTTARSAGLTLSYLLFDFGGRAAGRENAKQLLAAAKASRDSTIQSIFLTAVQSYYNTLATQAALFAANKSEQAAALSYAASSARYRAGTATPADKLSAQTAWSQARLNRINAEGVLHKARGALANTLGLDANRTITLVEAVDQPPDMSFEQNIQTLIDEAKRLRPDLRAAEAQIRAAEAGVTAAEAAGKPSLSLVASGNRRDSAGLTSNTSSLGVNLSVPLFSGYAPTYRIRAAEAQVESSKARAEQLSTQVALDVWNAYHALMTATESVRTSDDLLASAEQSERVALGRYQAGVGSMLDVLNAQSALASARQQHIQARLDWNVGRVALAQAMGTLDGTLLDTPAYTKENSKR
jgi:TolC family type I secretion outer membrane protein